MYVPPRYRVTDDATIDEFIRANGFATLVSTGSAGTMASHIPLELDHEDGVRVLRGHVSKANAQWKQLAEAREALAIFLGPHTYISPAWYDHPNVPTWNYQAVHCYGTVSVKQAADALHPDLAQLGAHYGFDLEAMPADLRASEMKGIVGFELRVTRVEAAFKLSQNRHDADKASIIEALMARGDEMSRAIAEAMRR